MAKVAITAAPNNALICGIFCSLIIMGCVNFLSYKVMYSAYGEKYAFFASQGINVLFVIYGGMIVYPLQLFTDKITPEMTSLPKRKFMIMGLLDCFGTFFTAMGAVYTPGQIQTLLNQCLIPLTLFASLMFLKSKYNIKQLVGAVVILAGAASVVIPSIVTQSFSSNEIRWYSCLVYVLSNVPMACSAVYKEHAFKNFRVNVYYLTQWVSIYQLGFGFLLAPLQMIPGVGSPNGISFNEIITNFQGGFNCCFGIGDECTGKYTLLLITGYCLANFIFNTTGLFLMKHASANLNSLTYAVLLPVTTVTFSFKFLGPYRESLNYYTIAGLVLVLAGVSLYHYYSPELINARNAKTAPNENTSVLIASPRVGIPSSYQERIVGMRKAHRENSSECSTLECTRSV